MAVKTATNDTSAASTYEGSAVKPTPDAPSSQQTTPQEEAKRNGMAYTNSGLQGYDRNSAVNRNRGTDRNDLNGEQAALTQSRQQAAANDAAAKAAQSAQNKAAVKESRLDDAQGRVSSVIEGDPLGAEDLIAGKQDKRDARQATTPGETDNSDSGSKPQDAVDSVVNPGGTGGSTTPGGNSIPAADNGGSASTPQGDVDSVVNPGDTTSRLVNSVTAPDTSGVKNIDHVDTTGMNDRTNQIYDSAEEQAKLQIDKTVEDGVAALKQNEEDAAVEYQNQRNQINATEALSKDNQALYAEARGDRGGIGAAQYDSIMNTAAINRQNVNLAQEKLATDTAREIEKLRADGEFQKANALLSIAQERLSALNQIEQWGIEANLSVDQINNEIEKWKVQLDLEVQQLKINTEISGANATGAFADGTSTLAAKQQNDSQLASVGSALLEQGIMPSEQQWRAMGFTSEDQVKAYIESKKPKTGSGGSVNTEYIDIYDANGNYLGQQSVYEYQKTNMRHTKPTGKMDQATADRLAVTHPGAVAKNPATGETYGATT